jgi:Kef-type K+ transport system membrane component KefB
MDSILVGVGMIPRLEMAIVTVTIAISHGIIVGDDAHNILATTILVCIISAIITPLMIKALTARNNN